MLPILLSDAPKNIVAQNQTGTGKTVASVIAMLNHVDANKNYPQILCLLPTSESAAQTGGIVTKLAQYLPIKLRCVVEGGESKFYHFTVE